MIRLQKSEMAKFMAYANTEFPDRNPSEHHDPDKTTEGKNVKEQCPVSTYPEISPEAHPLLGYGSAV